MEDQLQIHVATATGSLAKMQKDTDQREGNTFNKWRWENWEESSLLPYTKIYFECIEDLSIRPATPKLVEENVRKCLSSISVALVKHHDQGKKELFGPMVSEGRVHHNREAWE